MTLDLFRVRMQLRTSLSWSEKVAPASLLDCLTPQNFRYRTKSLWLVSCSYSVFIWWERGYHIWEGKHLLFGRNEFWIRREDSGQSRDGSCGISSPEFVIGFPCRIFMCVFKLHSTKTLSVLNFFEQRSLVVEMSNIFCPWNFRYLF